MPQRCRRSTRGFPRSLIPVASATVHNDCRVEPGTRAKLDSRATDETFGIERADAEKELEARVETLALLHNRLFAEHKRSVLLVLQGLDASGKDGTIKRVFTGVNPQGCRVHSFKAPAGSELDHDYLWRVHAVLPARGEIGIFNRSHYEDIVTCKVLGLIDEKERTRRVEHVKEFERMLDDEGTRVLKVFLHVGKDEQRKRLQARLDDPEKRWKFRAEDLDTRAQVGPVPGRVRRRDHAHLDEVGALVRRACRSEVADGVSRGRAAVRDARGDGPEASAAFGGSRRARRRVATFRGRTDAAEPRTAERGSNVNAVP